MSRKHIKIARFVKKISKAVGQGIAKPSKQMVVRTKQYNKKALTYWLQSPYYRYIRQFVGRRPFTAFVLLPWVFSAFYLLLIKTPIYESTARVLIEKNSKDANLMINLGFLGKSGQSGSDDKNVQMTKEFIGSRDLLSKLEQQLKVTQHYNSKQVDFFSRLSSHAKANERLKYYQTMVEALYDNLTGELILYARAYDPNYSYQLLNQIIQETKIFANRVSNTLSSEQFNFTEQQLKKAKGKLVYSEKAIVSFQNEHGVLDPKRSIETVSKVMEGLKTRLVTKQTELITLSAFMDPGASKIIGLKKEIAAIKQQIKQQTHSLIGQKSDHLNSLYAQFQWLMLDQKFALAEYEASQQAMNMAMVDVAKNQELVIVISPPTVPDDYEYPHVLYDLAAILIGLIISYSLVKMTYMIVREHVD